MSFLVGHICCFGKQKIFHISFRKYPPKIVSAIGVPVPLRQDIQSRHILHFFKHNMGSWSPVLHWNWSVQFSGWISSRGHEIVSWWNISAKNIVSSPRPQIPNIGQKHFFLGTLRTWRVFPATKYIFFVETQHRTGQFFPAPTQFVQQRVSWAGEKSN